MKRHLCKFYSCFLLNALLAATKNTTDKTTEMIKGTVNSVMEIFPEIRSTFREARTIGFRADNGLTILKTEKRATIPPVNRMLVKVCLNRTQPSMRMLRYRNPIIHMKNADGTI